MLFDDLKVFFKNISQLIWWSEFFQVVYFSKAGKIAIFFLNYNVTKTLLP